VSTPLNVRRLVPKEPKRLYCNSCGSMQDARKVGKSAEYTLDCGHVRSLMSSEIVHERNEKANA
jgi:hypothetical protein